MAVSKSTARFSLDLIATNDESAHEPEASKPQEEKSRNPEDKIHSSHPIRFETRAILSNATCMPPRP